MEADAGSNWELIGDLQHLRCGVEVLLQEGDFSQSIEDVNMICSFFQWKYSCIGGNFN